MARIGRAVVLWAAFVALFLVGSRALGPTLDQGAVPPEEAARSLALVAAIAAVDVAVLGAWIARARSRGVRLWAEAVVVLYGVMTFSSQLETAWFVDPRFVPRELLPHLFAMTVPLALLWPALAVPLLAPRGAPEPEVPTGRSPAATALQVGLAGAVLYPVLFFGFGYEVAWQSAAVRSYYGGPAVPLPLVDHLSATFAADPWVIPFEVARGLLWVALGWPVLRRTRGPWWVGGVLYALAMALVQNDLHWLPNPLMPAPVRAWHFVETSSSNALFALGTAALLAPAGTFSRLLAPAQRSGWNRPLAAASGSLEAFVGLGGLVGGLLLVLDPTGGRLGLGLERLAATPFADYSVPGMVLLLANGVLPLVALGAVVARLRIVPGLAVASAVVLLGWMAAQIGWLGLVFWLQGLLLAVGVALLAVGAAWTASRRSVG